MKFMGSKAAMLRNGLGHVLRSELRESSAFADLFAGSASVSRFVACHSTVRVESNDLQSFSHPLALAVTGRIRPVSSARIWAEWFERANRRWLSTPGWSAAQRLQQANWDDVDRIVARARSISSGSRQDIVLAYGGYYFSPLQAMVISGFREALPRQSPDREVALAALIQAASACCAAPGHTAQPFSTRTGSSRFLFEAWRRNPIEVAQRELRSLAEMHALTIGNATTGDALVAAQRLTNGHLVFLDPPYSDVQYSRFYHVLESVAAGTSGTVRGTGRYPDREDRPQSRYSRRGSVQIALDELLRTIAERGARTVLTFPASDATNGLSGRVVEEMALRSFTVTRRMIRSTFSTLGGNGTHRPARQMTEELVLVLAPRRVTKRRAVTAGR